MTGFGQGSNIGFGICDVLDSFQTNGGEGARTEPEVVFAAPAGEIMSAFVTLLCVVGDFVLVQAVCREELHDAAEKTLLGEFVAVEFTGAEFFEELSVLLVGEAVGGDVVGRPEGGLLEISLPFFGGLVGDGEHQIDVH